MRQRWRIALTLALLLGALLAILFHAPRPAGSGSRRRETAAPSTPRVAPEYAGEISPARPLIQPIQASFTAPGVAVTAVDERLSPGSLSWCAWRAVGDLRDLCGPSADRVLRCFGFSCSLAIPSPVSFG